MNPLQLYAEAATRYRAALDNLHSAERALALAEIALADYQARVRQRPKPKKRPPAACGTEGGYYRHVRTTKTPPCDPCKRAHRDEEARRRERREVA